MAPGYTNPHIEITAQDCIDEGPAWGDVEETPSPTEVPGEKLEAGDNKDAGGDAGVAQDGDCAEAPVVDGTKVTGPAKSKENETDNAGTIRSTAEGPSQAGQDKQVLTLRSKEKHVAAEKAALKREDEQSSIGASPKSDRAAEASDSDAGQKDGRLSKAKDSMVKEGALAKDVALQYLARAEEAATRWLKLGQGQGQPDEEE